MRTPQAAIALARISDDREGVAAGVTRQTEDMEALATRLGWQIAQVVIENDTSAYKRRRVRLPNGKTELRVHRPGFRRALELIQSGQADGLIAYDLDRVARDPRDLEDLIDIVESRSPRIPVESVTGSLRLANDADVTMARIMCAIANKSSRDTGRRVARKHEELARAGKYAGGGARRYGYERDGVTLRDDEAAAIREAAARIIAGESALSICRDFDERMILPVKAQRWSSKALLDILRSGRIAGLRVHRGEVVGPAQWPAIIDAQTREQLLARLYENSRGRGKPSLRYWLNGLLFCGLCGNELAGAWVSETRWRYWCRSYPQRGQIGCHKIAIAGQGAEDEISRQVLEYLTRPDVVSALAQGASNAAIADTRRLQAEDEQALRELARAHGNRQISMGEWLEARAPIDARLRGYAEALAAVVPMEARRVIATKNRAGAWNDLGPAGKRDLARIILGVAGAQGWEVGPANLSKPRRFDPQRLRLMPAEKRDE